MDNDESQCAICFDSISTETAFKGMKCKHLFHAQCLTDYINQYEFKRKIHSCPTCQIPYNYKLLNINDSALDETSQESCQKKYDELKSNVLCSICLLEYDNQNNLPTGLSSCTHIYHSECIKNWLNECGTHKKSGDCPQCKRPFEEVNLKPRNDIFVLLLKLKKELTFPEIFTVFLKDLSNKSHPMQIKRSTTVEEFAQRVGEMLDIPVEEMMFTVQGKTLSFNIKDKLIDHDIKIKSVIFLIQKFNGGEQ